MLHFSVIDLAPGDLHQAWPIVRKSAAEQCVEEWQERAEHLVRRGGGILGVACEGGGLMGVATYEPVNNAHLGKVLRIETLATFELTRRARVRQMLCAELDGLAPRLGCEALAVCVPKHRCAGNPATPLRRAPKERSR